jgi:hypothetical protein
MQLIHGWLHLSNGNYGKYETLIGCCLGKSMVESSWTHLDCLPISEIWGSSERAEHGLPKASGQLHLVFCR